MFAALTEGQFDARSARGSKWCLMTANPDMMKATPSGCCGAPVLAILLVSRLCVAGTLRFNEAVIFVRIKQLQARDVNKLHPSRCGAGVSTLRTVRQQHYSSSSYTPRTAIANPRLKTASQIILTIDGQSAMSLGSCTSS
jgi:hypothetical protein